MSERAIGIGDVKDALPEDSDVEIWRDAGVIEIVLGPKASMDIETVDIGKCSDEAFDFLEKNEVKSLFATDEKRICKPLDLSYDDRIYYWWLRSPYEEYDNAAFVDADGDFDGERVDSDYIGVRPAMWVKLED